MKKEVKISIFSSQIESEELEASDIVPVEPDPEELEMVVNGIYYTKEGLHYLMYNEYLDEDTEHPAKNLIKFDGSRLEMTKRGAVNTVMTFDPEENCTANYLTPYGPIFMGIITEDYSMTESEKGIDIDVRYMLDFNRSFAKNCKLNIRVDM